MAIVDVIKYNGHIDEFIWKYPSDEISTWTQLVVNETQEVIFIKDGLICDLFTAGKYTLETNNIPVLNKIVNIPFGGKSPFKAEVFYVNKRVNLDVKWGTPSPIQLQDAKYKIFISVKAFGQFGIRIENTTLFFRKLVGTKLNFTKAEINNYFRGFYLTKIKDVISSYIIHKKISILEINAYIGELSEYIKKSMEENFKDYGIELVSFYINDINVSEDDYSVKKLKEALTKRAEMEIVGYNYMQERSFDTLEGAAKNNSVSTVSSNFIGAGIGMAMGGVIGNSFSENINSNLKTSPDEKIECVNCKKPIEREEKFCSYCGTSQFKTCSNCGAIQKNKEARFCNECGKELIKKCSQCNQEVETDSKFCSNCGNNLKGE